MLSAAFLIQVGLHGLTGAMSFLLGARWIGADGGGAAMLLALVLVTAVAAAALGSLVEARWRHARAAVVTDRPQPLAEPAASGRLPAHDALTGLPNRIAFLERLQAVLAGARQRDGRAAVLCVDLADFKAINETLGYVAGDVLLRHAAARMHAVLRDSDMLARMGGDEFAILQYGIATPDGAVELCERLLAVMDEPFELCGRLTRSGHASGSPCCRRMVLAPRSCSSAPVSRSAGPSMARREASASSKTLWTITFASKALALDLRDAVERGEFEIEYQPQFGIRSRRMFGVEALLRWQHPQRGRLAPDVFIPLAEDSG